jgi:plasminogen activator
MRHLFTMAAGLASCLCTHAVASDMTHALFSNQKINVSAAIGKMSVQANESLYELPANNKVSELDWHTHSIDILSADINYAPNQWFSVGLRGWTSLTQGNAIMDDYDWDDIRRSDWTRWSHHPTTRQQYANEIDLNGTFWFLQQLSYRIGAVAGYQKSKYSWAGYGGHYIYEDPIFGPLWIYTFDKPDSELVLGYKQTFNTPYLGISAQWQQGKWSADVLGKYSQWTTVYADDEHYARSLYHRSTLNGGKYYALSLKAGYDITPSTRFFVQATYSKHTQSSNGDTQVYNHKTGATSSFTTNTVGASNRSHSLSVGLRHAF